MDPCGTPNFIIRSVELWVAIDTYCFLFFKFVFINELTMPLISYFSNFRRRILFETESKAFLTYKNNNAEISLFCMLSWLEVIKSRIDE